MRECSVKNMGMKYKKEVLSNAEDLFHLIFVIFMPVQLAQQKL